MRKFVFIGLILGMWLPSNGQEQREELRSIFFGGGSYYIDSEQINELNNFVKTLPKLTYYDVIIISHTDNIGGKEFNQRLSELRSAAVIQQLKRMGVQSEQIKYRNDGMENPTFSNDTNTGRMQNRRVDIIFKPVIF